MCPVTRSHEISSGWFGCDFKYLHYNDVIMRALASQITSLTIVYSTVYSGSDQRKHQSSVAGVCAGNSPGTGEFPTQRASYAENFSIWWRHHVIFKRNLLIDSLIISGGIVLKWIPRGHIDVLSTMVMQCWRQTTSYYLNRCWPKTQDTARGVTRQ